MMILILRSLLFDLFFYIFTTVYLIILFPFMCLLPRSFCRKIFRFWSTIIAKALDVIVGLRQEIQNHDVLLRMVENSPCILAMKHQSAAETIYCSLLLENFVIVLKKELTRIPIYGLYLKKLKSIVVDRSNGSKALSLLLRQSEKAIQDGFSILIFPEGTRQAPGVSIPYKNGITSLYKSLQVPVIPIALNTGVFWGRRSFIKKPGRIIYKVLDPILPGLDRKTFLETLQNRLDTESNALIPGFVNA